MEDAAVLRFLSISSVALLLPTGGVVTALLSEPIEETEFRRVCESVCATTPLAVRVALGEYVTEKYAFTGCTLQLPRVPEVHGPTKFRRIACV